MGTENTQEEELKLKENADGTVTVGDEPLAAAAANDAGHDDEDQNRLAADNDDHDNDETGTDENAVAGETPEQRAARRREERKQGKIRRKNYVDSLKTELGAMRRELDEARQRLDVVDRRSTGAEMAQLEHAEREAKDWYEKYKDEHSRAVESADGVAATEAQERMILCRQRLQQIDNIKTNYKRSQNTPPPLDARLKNHAERWMSDNPWFDPAKNDEDSSIARTLDERLAREGYDPRSPEYWDELSRRVEKYLPHRVKQRYNGSKDSSESGGRENGGEQRRSVVAGSGRDASSSGGNGTSFTLSAERVKAIKDAGMWDDPKQRAKMIRNYQEHDRQQSAGN